MAKRYLALAVFVFSFVPIIDAFAEPQKKCTATFPGGQKGVLVMEGKEPISYRSGYYSNDVPIRSGNTIVIEAARFKINSETDKIIKGRWSLNGHLFSLTFVCK